MLDIYFLFYIKLIIINYNVFNYTIFNRNLFGSQIKEIPSKIEKLSKLKQL